MFRRFSVNFALFSIGLDTFFVVTSLLAAQNLRPILNSLPFAAAINTRLQLPIAVYIIFPITWIGIFLLLAVYDGRRNFRLTDEIYSITISSLLATVSMAGMLYLSFREISRLLFLLFVGQAFIGIIAWRMIYRIALRVSKSRPSSFRRVLIAGAGPVGRKLQASILSNPYLGLTVVGFLDDNPNKRRQHADILGSIASGRKQVTNHNIDDVVIALPQRAFKRTSCLVAELSDLPVKVWVIPDFFQLTLHKAHVEEFAGLPMLDLRAPALNDFQRMVKRTFDLAIISAGILPAMLIMAVIAVAIRLEGPGPILFRQQRVGENGKVFDMLKFRTMVPNADALRYLVEHHDENGNFIHKTRDDPRVTRVGHVIRRASLDELPQIFNIIKGEMSLVGPRPELPYLVERYEPWQRTRFAVPQGVTGWWQVNGRSDKPMHLHTEDDIYYVQNYSLLLDVQILFKTIGVVLRGKGAY